MSDSVWRPRHCQSKNHHVCGGFLLFGELIIKMMVINEWGAGGFVYSHEKHIAPRTAGRRADRASMVRGDVSAERGR